ncbi:MAG: hypothetical protein ABIB47_00640 [Candidatus Woesearchaeota archaeon]
MVYIALLFGAILALTHYLSENFHYHKNKWRIISFGAGVMLAYLILDLFPRLYIGINFFNNFLFLFVLLGFALLHLIEKYIYQHASKEKKLRDLKETHSIVFFLYYVIIGILLKSIVDIGFWGGLLFFLPLVFHTTLGAASLKDIHHTIIKKKSLRLLLSASPVIGVLIASFFVVPVMVYYALLAFISGVFLFVVIREVIPKENKGDPMDFILGMSVYSLLIIFTWLV